MSPDPSRSADRTGGEGPSQGKGHGWAEGEETRDGVVLLCECGWRSLPSRDGVEAGRAWDAHLRSVRGGPASRVRSAGGPP